MSQRQGHAAAIVLGSFLCTVRTDAVEVYRWVDENGTTHFSDVLPERGDGVTTLRLPDSEPPGRSNATTASSAGAPPAGPERSAPMDVRDGTPAGASSSETVPIATAAPDHARATRRVVVQYMPGYPLRPGWVSDGFAVQQKALDAAGLSGERPASINSRGHAARVEQSRRLPVIASEIAAGEPRKRK
jgi:hypothetical protein